MAIRHAEAIWEGNLRDGKGTMKLGSGAFEGNYSFASRFESGDGTNPEELIGAAHAGCFAMAFAGAVARAGYTPQRIHAAAAVHLDKGDDGFRVTKIELEMQAAIPGIDEKTFQEHAEGAKENCPISQLLKPGTEITLKAELTG